MSKTKTYDLLLQLLKTRRSVSQFWPDPVPEDAIDKIVEVARREDWGRPLEEIVQRERYDTSKRMSNEAVAKYLYSLRPGTASADTASRAATAEEKN
ncbi:MAG TPA: hypothetical protein VNM15_10325 [Candidatus Binatia bacterium]|nr:hypothetical protein [Candidatus Binatia bacterium]